MPEALTVWPKAATPRHTHSLQHSLGHRILPEARLLYLKPIRLSMVPGSGMVRTENSNLSRGRTVSTKSQGEDTDDVLS